MKVKKSLCSLDKDDIKDNLTDIIEVLDKPKYVCQRCVRTANKAKNLCKPTRIEAKKKKD